MFYCYPLCIRGNKRFWPLLVHVKFPLATTQPQSGVQNFECYIFNNTRNKDSSIIKAAFLC